VYYITHQDDGRFRHPIDPIVMIFAACGMHALFSRCDGEISPASNQESESSEGEAERWAEDTVG